MPLQRRATSPHRTSPIAAIQHLACCACSAFLLPPCRLNHAETNDTTIFNALTLLVVLGTSLITQIAGLSLALGAFLAGLLLAETEYHLQVRNASALALPTCLVMQWSPR